jgi:predicted dehydrogenase
MTGDNIGFGVIGLGIGVLHARKIAEIEGCELVAVADSDEQRWERVSDLGCECYADYRRLLEHPDIAVVCVCTPSGMHARTAIECARAGKHVLVEKPIDIALDAADALIRVCDEQGVKLGVVSQLRFCDPSRKVKAALEAQVLGRLVLGDLYMKFHRSQEYYDSAGWRGTKAMDGGALMNQGVHGLDLLLWLMGPVAEVRGHALTLARKVEVEDTAAAVVRFRSGAIGVVEAATSVWPGQPQRLEIHGENGTIVLAGTERTFIQTWRILGETEQDAGKHEEQGETVGGQMGPFAAGGIPHRRQIADMAAAVREDRPPAVTGRDGRRTVELIHAIYRSSANGKAVELPT